MRNLPKDFALQLGSLVALYVSLAAFLTLIFAMVNIAMPDAADLVWQVRNNQETLKFSLSCLVVFFPAYLCLTRKVNLRRREAEQTYTTFTKWLIYLSLLVGGLVMLGDLVTIVHTFLNGEITARFLLKSGSLLCVVGLVFYYYVLDARGYWQLHEQHSLMYGAVATFVVASMMVASFYHIESPAETREKRLDDRQVEDFKELYWRLEEHHLTYGYLPESLNEPYAPDMAPTAPEGRPPYTYNILNDYEYQLCGYFAAESDFVPQPRTVKDPLAISWYHEAGDWCYDLTVTHNHDVLTE